MTDKQLTADVQNAIKILRSQPTGCAATDVWEELSFARQKISAAIDVLEGRV